MWDTGGSRRLGATVKRIRTERGLSQETLAYRAGITKNQLQLIEGGRSSGRRDDQGHSNPRLATLVGLADVLGMTVSELMGDAQL